MLQGSTLTWLFCRLLCILLSVLFKTSKRDITIPPYYCYSAFSNFILRGTSTTNETPTSSFLFFLCITTDKVFKKPVWMHIAETERERLRATRGGPLGTFLSCSTGIPSLFHSSNQKMHLQFNSIINLLTVCTVINPLSPPGQFESLSTPHNVYIHNKSNRNKELLSHALYKLVSQSLSPPNKS